MFYLLNQKFAEKVRRVAFEELRVSAEHRCYKLTIDSDLEVFDEIIEIINELKVQRTSHAVSKPAVTNPAALTVVPSEEVKF
jgi:hypothetical protein